MASVDQKKLLILINSLECGGAERVASILSSEFQKHNIDVSMVLLEDNNRFYNISPEVSLIDIGTNNLFRATIKLKKLILMKKPDVVLSFLHRSNYINILCSLWLKNYTCIISERTFTSMRFSKGFSAIINRFFVKYLYPLSSRVIAVSEGVKKDLTINFGIKSNIYAINNPYDIELIKQRSLLNNVFKSKKYICSLGRLEKIKGIDVMIKAYIKSDIEEDLIIIGAGSQKQELENIVLGSNCENRIHFLGLQDNPFPILRDSKCFVLPSRYEGFPNALLEAMCLGVPVIASDCNSGPGDILEGKATGEEAVIAKFGILVPVGNEHALKNAIEMICNNIDLSAHFRARSLQRSKDFSADVVIHDYIQVVFEGNMEASE